MAKTKEGKSALLFSLKAGTSLGLLAFLFSRLDLRQFSQTVFAANLYYLGLAIAAYSLAKIITSARWALLARPLGFTNPFKEFAVFYFFGVFFNLFAPSTLGGDAGRMYYLCRGQALGSGKTWKASASRALISVAADRATGLAVLVWIGAVALLFFPGYARLVPRIMRHVVLAAALGFLFAWLLLPFAASLLRPLRRPWVQTARDALTAYGSNYWLGSQAVLLSLVIHLMQTGIQVLLGRALGVEIPWSYCFIFFPLVDILSMLPVSFSGIGLREGGYFFFLGKLGIRPEVAIACGILWLVVVMANGLIGGILFLIHEGGAVAPSTGEDPLA